MNLARGLLIAHVAAVAMATFSLLVLIPHPELWQGLPGSAQAFAWAMDRAGPVHIVATLQQRRHARYQLRRRRR
ncbi:MAG TPA: hypothetical protein PKA64_18860, partial [Myxococcota bacterium]|nr:hypothetical protein [Myxococcota bacterium]